MIMEKIMDLGNLISDVGIVENVFSGINKQRLDHLFECAQSVIIVNRDFDDYINVWRDNYCTLYLFTISILVMKEVITQKESVVIEYIIDHAVGPNPNNRMKTDSIITILREELRIANKK